MNAATAADITIRAGAKADAAFIYSTWINSYRHSAFAMPMAKDTFCAKHHDVVERLLARSRVTVASPPGDPLTILGYAVTEPGVVHFVYVKEAFRRFGVAAALCADIEGAFTCTHLTRDASDILQRWKHDNALRVGKCPRCARPLTAIVRNKVDLRECANARCAWSFEVKPDAVFRAHPAVEYDPYRALVSP